MPWVEICVDENVPEAYLTVLRSNGFTAIRAQHQRGEGTVDEALLGWCGEQKYVLLTNDTDFVDLAMETDHAGVIVSTSQSLDPGQVAKADRRIDRQYAKQALHGSLVWLNNWL